MKLKSLCEEVTTVKGLAFLVQQAFLELGYELKLGAKDGYVTGELVFHNGGASWGNMLVFTSLNTLFIDEADTIKHNSVNELLQQLPQSHYHVVPTLSYLTRFLATVFNLSK